MKTNSPKAVFTRTETSDDVQTHQPPFEERLIATRKWLIEEHRKGEVDWKETIDAIERTLNEMGIQYE